MKLLTIKNNLIKILLPSILLLSFAVTISMKIEEKKLESKETKINKDPRLLQDFDLSKIDTPIYPNPKISWHASNNFLIIKNLLINLEKNKLLVLKTKDSSYKFINSQDWIEKSNHLGLEIKKFDPIEGKLFNGRADFKINNLYYPKCDLTGTNYISSIKTQERNITNKVYSINFTDKEIKLMKEITINPKFQLNENYIKEIYFDSTHDLLTFIYLAQDNKDKIKIFNASKETIELPINNKKLGDGNTKLIYPLTKIKKNTQIPTNKLLIVDYKSTYTIDHEYFPTSKATLSILKLGQSAVEIKRQYSIKFDEQSIIDINPTGKMIAVTDNNDPENIKINILELKSGAEMFSLKGHKTIISDLNFSNDGKKLASIDRDQQLKIWNVQPMEIKKVEKFSDVTVTTEI